MKLLRTWISPLLAFGFAAIANAAPVQYQITGTYSYEYILDGTTFTSVSGNDYLIADAPTASATFFYDSATPATSTNIPNPDLGPYSYYTGAAINLSGSVAGHAFSSSSADAQVYNVGSAFFGDIVSIVAGTHVNVESPAQTSLQGFSIGDYTLTGLAFSVGGPSGFAPDQSLPTDLSVPYSQIQLTFTNSLGEMRAVFFGIPFDSTIGSPVTPVPLPSSILFFISGLAGLGVNAYRKSKNRQRISRQYRRN